MGFKLLRVDVNDTCKIQLEVGKHLIGRGKFLHCDDKRVSRSHGELEVTENSVNLKSLHTNPCFYVRKGTDTRGMIKQNESIDLRNGDKFGLLPVDCWYEVLYTTNDDEEIGQKPVKQESQIQNGRINETNKAMFDSTEVDNDFAERMDHMDSTLMLGPQSSNENVLPPPQTDNDPPLSPIYESDMSQSLIQDLQLPEPREDVASDKVPSIGDAVNPEDLLQNPSVENPPVSVKAEPVDRDSVVHQSPLKRSPSSDANQGPSEVKKIKTDPDDVAGTSNGCDAMARSWSRWHSTESTKSRLTDEVLEKISAHLSQPQPTAMDRWDHIAKAWAASMRDLAKTQQIFAEKLINDVLFEAQLNSLRRESRINVASPAVTIDLTNFSNM